MIQQFYKPASVGEAVKIHKENPKSIWYGGGTQINYFPAGIAAEQVIGLENLGIDSIDMDGDTLKIGGAATVQKIIDSEDVLSVLREAASLIYSRNIRNIATIGGNIGAKRRDSAIIPCLVALGAGIETAGEGRISVEDYVKGEHESLILSVHVPKPAGSCSVRKISRSAGSEPVIQAAVYIEGRWGNVQEAVVAVGGTAPPGTRLEQVEEGLINGSLKDLNMVETATAKAVDPQTDIHGSADYKRYITGVAVADCVSNCVGRD